jgi:hypothetical protein
MRSRRRSERRRIRRKRTRRSETGVRSSTRRT